MNWWRRLFHSSRLDKELDVELRFHLERQIADKMRSGMTEQAARRAAHLSFGGATQIKEDCRESRGTMWVHSTWQDLLYALRRLGRDRTFTVTGIVILGLGIGANTIVFSAVDHILLRAIPYQQADRLFAIHGLSRSHGSEPMQVSAADFYDWQAQSRTFQSIAAYASWPMNLTEVEEPRRLETQLVSANFFSTLGVSAEIGRTFLSGDDQEKSPSVVVISQHLWRSLGESPSIIGRRLTLNGSAATVVGVMPADFAYPAQDVDAWVPLSLNAQNRSNRDGRWLKVIGRLAPGVTSIAAITEMNLISRHLATAYPTSDAGWSVSLLSLQEEIIGKARPVLLTLQAAVFLLLLVACANLANLLLARALPRAREMATRAALGASRLRIMRQLLVESLMLAILGGSTGLALAIEGVRLVRTLSADFIPRASEIHLSFDIVLISILASVATVFLFGLAPALHLSHHNIAARLNSGAHGTARNIERNKGFLVSMELAMAAVLLIGAGLLGESLWRLVTTPTGYRADHLLTAQLTLPKSRYPSNASQIVFFDQVLTGIRMLPGVLAVGEISDTPLKGNNPTFEIVLAGASGRPSDPHPRAGLRVISPGLLDTAGIPVLSGRAFTAADRAGANPVAIVNESMVRQFWPGADPIGKKLRLTDDHQWMTVVGVVPQVKHMGLKEDEGPVFYLPYAQKTQAWMAWTTLVVRTTGDPMNFASEVRGAIRDLDRNQPIAEIGTMDAILHRSTAIPRFSTTVVCVLSALALTIALVGVYGLLSYTLSHSLKELAIRLTLGASPAHLAWLLFQRAMFRAVVGVAAGVFGAWWVVRWIESLLFGVHPHDGFVFAGVAGLLFLTTAATVLIPARRVMGIQPASALHVE